GMVRVGARAGPAVDHLLAAVIDAQGRPATARARELTGEDFGRARERGIDVTPQRDAVDDRTLQHVPLGGGLHSLTRSLRRQVRSGACIARRALAILGS